MIRYVVNNLDRDYPIGSVAIALGNDYFILKEILPSPLRRRTWIGKFAIVKYGEPAPATPVTIELNRYLSELRAEEIPDQT